MKLEPNTCKYQLKDNQLITIIIKSIADDDNFSNGSSTNEKMKTGSVRSNNNNHNTNNLNNNKIYADKFEVIENISNNNLNSNPPPSIDLLNYSNNNVYADIVDLDDTETLSLMYNAQQQFDRGRPHDRTLSNSSTKKPYDESFYLANSSSRSFGL
jgi:hypothetical protein